MYQMPQILTNMTQKLKEESDIEREYRLCMNKKKEERMRKEMKEINLVVEQKNGTIGVNFAEIKAALEAGLAEYKGMVFTEDSKADAKKTVASLRKLKKSVNDKKLEVKKSFMAPYTEFEEQVKELDKLIDEPITFINQQVEEFERKRVEEKRTLINELYTSIMEEHVEAADYLPLQKIYDSKWENSTTTKKAITDAITERVEHVEKDLATIRSMESEFEDKGIEKYKATLELSDALTTMNQYQKQKEEILRRQEEKKKAEETEKSVPEPTVEPEVQIMQESHSETEFVVPEPTVETVKYEVTAETFQIVELESAMRKIGIQYRRF